MYEDEKTLPENVFDITKPEQVYYPEKYQIMNTWSPLLWVSCGVHSHQMEKWEKWLISYNHIVLSHKYIRDLIMSALCYQFTSFV